jgi:hypothetical protein
MTLTQVVEEYVTVKRSTGLRFRSGAMILRTLTRVDTTNIYAEVDLAMKAKALSACSIPDTRSHWRKEPGLMAFLRSL